MSYSANTNLTSKIVHIRSEDGIPNSEAQADNLKTAFLIALEESINCGVHQSIVVSLNSMEFPMSFYNIHKYNNHMVWKEGVVDLDVFIPYGNYNVYQLAKELSKLMTLESAASALGWTWIITYDIITNKFTFDNGSGSFTFEFNNQNTLANPPYFDTPYIALGFENKSYLYVSPNTKSTNSIDVNGMRSALYVRTQLTSVGAIESISKQYSDILQKVPITAPPNAILYFISGAGTGVQSLIQTKNIPAINIRITDDQNRLVDTNGLNFTMSLQFDFIKTPEVTFPAIVRRLDRIQEQHSQLMLKKYRRIKQKKTAKTKEEKDIADSQIKGDEAQMKNLMSAMEHDKELLEHELPHAETQNLGSARVLNHTPSYNDFKG